MSDKSKNKQKLKNKDKDKDKDKDNKNKSIEEDESIKDDSLKKKEDSPKKKKDSPKKKKDKAKTKKKKNKSIKSEDEGSKEESPKKKDKTKSIKKEDSSKMDKKEKSPKKKKNKSIKSDDEGSKEESSKKKDKTKSIKKEDSPKKDKKEKSPKKNRKDKKEDFPKKDEDIVCLEAHDLSDNIILETVINDITDIIPIFESLKNLSTTCNIKFINKGNIEDGLFIAVIDSSNTTMTEILLNANSFGSIYCKSKVQTLKISIEKMCKILKYSTKGSRMKISYLLDDKSNLYIEVGEDSRPQEFKLEIYEPDGSLGKPKLCPHLALSFSSDEFHTICSNMKGWPSQYIKLQCSNNKLSITSDDNKYSSTFVDEEGGDIKMKWIDPQSDKNEIKNKYEIDSILYFQKCKKLCDSIVLYLKQDLPIMILYKIDIGEIKIYVSNKNDEKISDTFNDSDYGYSDSKAKPIKN